MKRSPLDGDEDSGSPKFRQQEEDDIAIAVAIEEWRSFKLQQEAMERA